MCFLKRSLGKVCLRKFVKLVINLKIRNLVEQFVCIRTNLFMKVNQLSDLQINFFASQIIKSNWPWFSGDGRRFMFQKL